MLKVKTPAISSQNCRAICVSAMSRRRRVIQEETNTDRWLVSYADFITLLFAFFVVMYSISSINVGKYRVLSDAMTSAFNPKLGVEIQPGSQLGISVQRAPISVGNEGQAARKELKDMAVKIRQDMQGLIKEGKITVRGNEKWLEIEINSSILFASAQASLSLQAKQVLSQLSENFRYTDNPIYVSGYTDDIPINTVKYASNWELSAARAASVVRLLAEQGIDPGRMGAIGFGEYRPLVANDSPQNRLRNRRVVIRMLVGDDLFSQASALDMDTTDNIAVKSAQSLRVNRLQAGEPARAIQ